jgi:hypothetical protein
MASRSTSAEPGDAEVLTNAVIKTAASWGLINAKLGVVLGLSPATA